MSLQANHIVNASECERKAEEALDYTVKRYFTKLARDYRHLAEQAENGIGRERSE
jgi:hypothetical protein